MPNKESVSQKIELLHKKVKQLQSEKYSDDDIISTLENEGIDRHYAQTILENIDDEKADNKSFRNSVIMGFFYLGGGLLLNFLSEKISENNGFNMQLIFYGIIILGISTIIRGFILYKR